MKYIKLEKIISGGQTGADQAGLKFAYQAGISTGGIAPKDFRTEKGTETELLRDMYGLVETKSDSKDFYRARTIENVKMADGTIIFAERMSPGSKLTKNTCLNLRKPYVFNPTSLEFLDWLMENNIKILNVAGNRESVSPGIETKVFQFLQLTIDEQKK